MPELPEVETIKRIIEPQIKGLKIRGADVCNRQIVAYPSVDEFVEILLGRTIEKMERRGKFLIFVLDNGDRMFLHLRMTGQLLVTPPDHPLEKHTHLMIHLEDETQIRYIDVRRFGRFWYIKKDEDESITGINKLGLEPFEEELTATYLREQMGKKRKAVKEMLLDQSIVVGIGNIYSDEILYKAGIHPENKCTELTEWDWEKNVPFVEIFSNELLWAAGAAVFVRSVR